MTGDRRSGVVVCALILSVACGGGRETGKQGSTSRDTAVALPDTAAPPATRPDTAAAPQDTPRAAAAKPTPPPVPAPKPVPVRKPPTTLKPARADTAAPAPGESAQANAPAAVTTPPNDPYHQAPRDTVTAEVYEGWKQYNLNCARCHGEDVLGTTIAPHLIVSVRPGGAVDTKEKFIQTVCAGRPEKGMPSWCALGMEMEKINATYEYVKGRSEGKIAPGRPARRQ